MTSHNSVLGAGVVPGNEGARSEEDEKMIGSGVDRMNGHEKTSADHEAGPADSSGMQQERANNTSEALTPAAVEVPIGQINYGHDASANSPDRDYSKITKSGETDVNAAGKSTASHSSCVHILGQLVEL